jgi:hypothetical protein
VAEGPPLEWAPWTERARDCATGAFELSLGPVGAEGGHDYAVFDLLNVSRSTCSLAGFAGMGLRRPDDHRVWLRVHHTTGAGWASPAVRRSLVRLAPGSAADFWMEWAGRTGRKAGSISVTPPGPGGGISVHNHVVELDVGRVTVSPVTSAVLDS